MTSRCYVAMLHASVVFRMQSFYIIQENERLSKVIYRRVIIHFCLTYAQKLIRFCGKSSIYSKGFVIDKTQFCSGVMKIILDFFKMLCSTGNLLE